MCCKHVKSMRWKIALVAKNRAVGWNHNPEDNFPAWAFRLRAGVAISVGGFQNFGVLFWHKKKIAMFPIHQEDLRPTKLAVTCERHLISC